MLEHQDPPEKKTLSPAEKILILSKSEFEAKIREVFAGEKWLVPFMESGHHGPAHGHQVFNDAKKLLENLTPQEQEQLRNEEIQHFKATVSSGASSQTMAGCRIAAFLHDSGRINNQGEFSRDEQENHPFLSAERAEYFCRQLEIPELISLVVEATERHDFQSEKFTPAYSPPESILAQVIQVADQSLWFDPNSIHRTLKFGTEHKQAFFNHKVSLVQRKNWVSGTTPPDTFTVAVPSFASL